MALSCLATAAADAAIASYTGFDPVSYSFWFVIPAGALLIGALAPSGALAAAYFLHIKPSKLDVLVMAPMSLACLGAITTCNTS